MQVTATVAQNEEEGMVRPLTKRRSNGQLYTRPPGVEAQIEEALKLDLATLRHRLETSDLQMPGYLRSECLVHLIREAVRTGDQDRIIDMVLPKLLLRCSVNLRKKIPDSALFDAESIREEVLSQLSEMFASDGTGSNLNELDFFEVHFNQAFRAHRIALLRKRKTASNTSYRSPCSAQTSRRKATKTFSPGFRKPRGLLRFKKAKSSFRSSGKRSMHYRRRNAKPSCSTLWDIRKNPKIRTK